MKNLFTKLLIIGILASFAVQAFAFTNTSKRRRRRRFPTSQMYKKLSQKKSIQKSGFSGSWKMGLNSGRVVDETNQATVSAASISAVLKYSFNKNLNFNLEPVASFSAGQAQSLYGDFEPGNHLGITEASVFFKPVNIFDVSFGILNQRRVDNELLVKSTNFPGAFSKIYLANFNQFKTILEVGVAIPTSYSLNSQASKMEKTPTFYTQSVRLVYAPIKNQSNELWLGHFTFNNLPSVVAEKSSIQGNTVTNRYDFDHEFDGISGGFRTSFNLYQDLLKMDLGARYLKNLKAPTGLNEGRLLEGSFTLRTLGSIDLVPGMAWFRNEPDASIAYYNSSELGNSNRKGYVYKMGVIFNTYRCKFNFKYIDSYLVYEDPYQARRKTLEIGLETFNVKF